MIKSPSIIAVPLIHQAWLKLSVLPLQSRIDPGPSYRSKLEWLDDIHRDRPEAARMALEEIVLQLLRNHDGKTLLNPLDLGELGVALALWATLPGIEPRHAAVEAAALGLEAAEGSNDEWCLGQCHWKAGVLLKELGHPELAIRFLHCAGFHFGVGGFALCAARVLGTKAALLSDLGRYDQSETHFNRQLRCLPPNATQARLASLTELATLAHRAGRVAEALRDLEAAELLGMEGPSHAFLLLKKTALLFECRENARAARTFSMTIEALADHGLYRDLAFASLDLTQYHEILGQPAEVKAIADRLDAWLPHLRGNTNVRPVLEDLVASSRLGRKIPESSFTKWRAKLQRRGAAPTVPTFGPGGLEAATRRRQSAAGPRPPQPELAAGELKKT